jgi:hypothetical protein
MVCPEVAASLIDDATEDTTDDATDDATDDTTDDALILNIAVTAAVTHVCVVRGSRTHDVFCRFHEDQCMLARQVPLPC